jgi:type VI secretion system secreted protein VgrG
MTLQAFFLHQSVPADAVVFDVRLEEGLNELFRCTVDISIPDPDFDLEATIWSTGAVQIFDDRFDPSDLEQCRFIHGAVERAVYVGPHVDEGHLYRFYLRPSLHGLAHRFRTRIFQHKSPIEVVQQVMEEAGIDMSSIQSNLDTYPPREYITQWKESELAFIQRWLEELGVHFWFEHTEVDHTMFVSDKGATHQAIVGDPNLPMVAFDSDRSAREGGVYGVRYQTRFTYDRWAARDWNFLTPDAPRDANAGEGGQEQYEYPGGYLDDAEGTKLSTVRAEEQVARKNELRGSTGCRRLSAGRTFFLLDAEPSGLIGEYLVTNAVHEYRRSRDTSGGAHGTFETQFVCIPKAVSFRPARTTPRPRVAGKESAVVTGPAGEEIHVDEHGRIKVHFYWDRENPVDDTASCWIRTQQQNTANAMFLPRVGWEVDIGFLHGDPDRPVMLQKLYNEEQMPPYALPGNLMQSSLQTSSSPGGGGTNELRMNDANGSQQLFMHAQKDLANTVGNNSTETIGVDSTVQVASNALHAVGGSETITIGGNQSVSVTGAIVAQCAASQSVSVGGLDDWGVSALHTVTTHGSRTDDIGGLLNVLAAAGIAHTFNASHSLSVGGALSINSAGPIAETVAGGKIEAVGGAKLEVVAKSKAEDIKVGKILNAGAVKITAGTDVALSAGAALGLNIGGSYSTTCGGDFGITGAAVTMKLSSLKMNAGSSVDASSGSITFKGSSLGGDGAKMLLKGTVKYK